MIDLQRTRFPRPRTDAIDPKPSLRSPRCKWLRRVDSGPSGLISQRRGSADDGHSGHAGTAGFAPPEPRRRRIHRNNAKALVIGSKQQDRRSRAAGSVPIPMGATIGALPR